MDRILNGADAEAPWPWIVRIGIKSKDLHYCAGTLISDRYVLTAEHCFSHITEMNPNDTTDLLRDTFLTFGDFEEGSKTFEVTPKKIFFRANRYEKNGLITNDLEPDLALLQIPSLKKRKMRNSVVKAACLPDQPVAPGTRCWVAGWGYTSREDLMSQDFSKLPQKLQEAPMHKLSAEYCRDHSELNIIEKKR